MWIVSQNECPNPVVINGYDISKLDVGKTAPYALFANIKGYKSQIIGMYKRKEDAMIVIKMICDAIDNDVKEFILPDSDDKIFETRLSVTKGKTHLRTTGKSK